MTPSVIRHSGVIKSITSTSIEVEIIAKSACASCHAQGSCNVSDTQEKFVTIYDQKSLSYTLGQNVYVLLQTNKGYEALLWGYLLPFVLLLLTLIVSLNFTSELNAGLLSIFVLAPYYILLYMFKAKMTNRFAFKIEEL